MKRQRGDVLINLVVGVIAVAAVGLIAGGAWLAFTGRYVEQGRREVRDQFAPLIAECDKRQLAPAACVDAWLAADRNYAQAVANLGTCEASAKAQSDAIQRADEAAARSRAATRQILADLAKQSEANRTAREALQRQAATPAATRKEACDEADALLAALASRRMRFAPGPAPGAGSQSGDGQSAGAGALRVGR